MTTSLQKSVIFCQIAKIRNRPIITNSTFSTVVERDAGLILSLHPANERRRYFVTMFLIGGRKSRIRPEILHRSTSYGVFCFIININNHSVLCNIMIFGWYDIQLHYYLIEEDNETIDFRLQALELQVRSRVFEDRPVCLLYPQANF